MRGDHGGVDYDVTPPPIRRTRARIEYQDKDNEETETLEQPGPNLGGVYVAWEQPL